MKKIVLAIVMLVLVTTALVACGARVEWYDADGTLLYRERMSDEATEIPDMPLPEDSDLWDYTEWKEITANEKQIVLQAQRIALKKYIWLDTDGTELHTELKPADAKAPLFDLPKNTSNWAYTGWTEKTEGSVTTYTAVREAVEEILFTNVDGNVLYRVYIKPGEEIPQRHLPNDTDEWHYTSWKKTTTADGGVKFVAQRVEKEKIVYLDVDGSLLYTDGKIPGEELELRAVPKNSDKWLYSAWEEVTVAGGDRTFRAVGEVNPSYFKANVFQIVVYDIAGKPIQTGTGFIFHQNGWFITNHHVLDGGVSAKAFFEIEDYLNGTSYTVLDIDKGFSSNPEKDIFIGRISSYSKISNKYKDIPIVREYAEGDITYSVGYPKSSVKMEIHEGEIVSEHDKDFNTLYEKLYSGVTYIPSSSYVHRGSSGGILVNEKLEVIGTTSRALFDSKDRFVMGAAIRAFTYMTLVNNVHTANEKSFLQVLYPQEGAVLELFVKAGQHENCVGVFSDGSRYFYQLIWENSYSNCEEAWGLQVYSDGTVVATLTRVFNSGDIFTSSLVGIYGSNWKIDDCSYVFTYNWSASESMIFVSENINYSVDINRTLMDYEMIEEGVSITSENINFAKGRFNETYEWFRDIMASLTK